MTMYQRLKKPLTLHENIFADNPGIDAENANATVYSLK